MTQEEKDLLLKDLCARLPYGVFLKIGEYSDYTLQGIVHSNANKPLIVRCNGSDFECSIEVVKPYLRPMSSMTEEERKEVEELIKSHKPSPDGIINNKGMDNLLFSVSSTSGYLIDWLNAHHFDYRGLIPIGLALKALERMY